MRNFIHFLLGYGALGYLVWVGYQCFQIHQDKGDILKEMSTHFWAIGIAFLLIIVLFLIPVKSSKE